MIKILFWLNIVSYIQLKNQKQTRFKDVKSFLDFLILNFCEKIITTLYH